MALAVGRDNLILSSIGSFHVDVFGSFDSFLPVVVVQNCLDDERMVWITATRYNWRRLMIGLAIVVVLLLFLGLLSLLGVVVARIELEIGRKFVVFDAVLSPLVCIPIL